MYATIDERWEKYLELPKEVFETTEPAPRVDALQHSLQQYDRVAADPKYKFLAQHPEFQSTHELLREYIRQRCEKLRPRSRCLRRRTVDAADADAPMAGALLAQLLAHPRQAC